jgi:hypothetical protein
MLVMIGDKITHIRPNQVIESSEKLLYDQLKDITPKKPRGRASKRKDDGTGSDS